MPSIITFINVFLKKRFPRLTHEEIAKAEIYSEKSKLKIMKKHIDGPEILNHLTKEDISYEHLM